MLKLNSYFKTCPIVITACLVLSITGHNILSATTPNSVLSQEKWIELQARHCGMTCQNGLMAINKTCSRLGCYICDCDKHCDLLGTCCPSYDKITDTYHYSFESSREKNPHQWYKKTDCRKPPAYEGTFLTVVKCSESWGDEAIREKCERPTLDSMASITPFGHKTTGLVFANVYCVICNEFDLSSSRLSEFGSNDTEMISPWTLRVDCLQYQTLYTITDTFQFFQVLGENDCIFRFEKLWETKYCNLPVITSPRPKPPGSCTSLNTFLGNICHSVPPIPALTVEGDSSIFCLFGCNESLPEISECRPAFTYWTGFMVRPNTLPPMFLSFDYTSINNTKADSVDGFDNLECPQGLWRNNQDNCSQAVCAPGKRLDKRGNSLTCRSALPDIRGLGYHVNFILVSLTEIKQNEFHYLDLAIQNRFSNVCDEVGLRVEFFSTYCPVDSQIGDDGLIYKQTIYVLITGHITAPPSISRDEFEDESLAFLLQGQWDVNLGSEYFGINKNVSLLLVSVGQEMVSLYRSLEKRTRHFFDNAEDAPPPLPVIPRYSRAAEKPSARLPGRVGIVHFPGTPSESGLDDSHVEQDLPQGISPGKPSQEQDLRPIISHAKSQSKSFTDPSIQFQKQDLRPSTLSRPMGRSENSINQTPRQGAYEIPMLQAGDLPIIRERKILRASSGETPPLSSQSTPFTNTEDLSSPDKDDPKPDRSSSVLPDIAIKATGNDHHSLHHRNRRLRRSGINSSQQTDPEVDCLKEQIWTEAIIFSRTTHYSRNNVLRMKHLFIDIVPSLRCPSVEVNFTGYSKLENGGLQFTLIYLDEEINVTYSALGMSYENGALFACLDYLNSFAIPPSSSDSSTCSFILEIALIVMTTCVFLMF